MKIPKTLEQRASGRIAVRVLRNEATKPYDKRDEWQRKANSYHLQLRFRPSPDASVRTYSFDYYQGTGIQTTPDETPLRVLESLLSDADVSAESFENFCADLGYDSDSRTSEAVYNECKQLRKQLERVLGDEFEAFLYAERS